MYTINIYSHTYIYSHIHIDIYVYIHVPIHTLPHISTGSDSIDLAFGKDRAKDRRDWLASHYIASQYIDPTLEKLTYSDFINKELIQYR